MPETELETKHKDAYPIIINTDIEMMRGIDYRSRKIGIDLFIAKSFENQREVQ